VLDLPLPTGNYNPLVTGLLGRVTYLGTTGKLFIEDSAWKGQLAGAGPVGRQLLERMSALEARGWSIGNLSMQDPFWKLTGKGLLGRSLRKLSLGGYHWDWDMQRDIPVKRIAINEGLVSAAGSMGMTYGNTTPAKTMATLMAHELGHEDGIIRDFGADWKQVASRLTPEEQQILARRMLATETNAIVSQLYVADAIGEHSFTTDRMKAALVRGDLGAFIHSTWGKSGGSYGAFGTMSRGEAKQFVNDYLASTYGSELIDPRTGKIREFDLTRGQGHQFGTISGDETLAARMAETRQGVTPPDSALGRFFAESATGRWALRGAGALGALAIIGTVADVGGAFRKSPAAGFGRVGRVGADWAGYEAGSAAGGLLGRSLLSVSERTPGFLGAALIIGGGYVGAQVLDSYLGGKIEQTVTSAIGSLTRRFHL